MKNIERHKSLKACASFIKTLCNEVAKDCQRVFAMLSDEERAEHQSEFDRALQKARSAGNQFDLTGVELRNCHDVFGANMHLTKMMENWVTGMEEAVMERLLDENVSSKDIDRQMLAQKICTIENALQKEEWIMFQIAEELAGLEERKFLWDIADEVTT